MGVVTILLLILALVFFLVAAVVGYGPTTERGWHRTNFIGLGLACWVATTLLNLVVR